MRDLSLFPKCYIISYMTSYITSEYSYFFGLIVIPFRAIALLGKEPFQLPILFIVELTSLPNFNIYLNIIRSSQLEPLYNFTIILLKTFFALNELRITLITQIYIFIFTSVLSQRRQFNEQLNKGLARYLIGSYITIQTELAK